MNATMTEPGLTVNQYMKEVKRLMGARSGVRHQTTTFPPPNHEQDHIAIWLESWPHEPRMIPTRHIAVYLEGGDWKGLLLRVRSDQRSPAEIVAALQESR